jgi:hypothetical protein
MTKPRILTQTGIAHRSYGGIDIPPIWMANEPRLMAVVGVSDQRESAPVEIPIEPYSALDVYCHSYAYEAAGAVEHDDGRFAV